MPLIQNVYLSVRDPDTALNYVTREIDKRTVIWWEDKSGKAVKLSEMSLPYLLNLRRFLIRASEENYRVLENLGEEQ